MGTKPTKPRLRQWIPACAGMTLALSLLLPTAQALEFRGHVKGQLTQVEFPGNSLYTDISDDPARDSGLDLRTNLGGSSGNWRWQADYQLLARRGDQLELQQANPTITSGARALPDDDNRVFDLTHRISESDNRAVTHRLDRLYLSHTSDKTVLNLGRQAVSWGNGLIYNPVDFFNPFDPAAIDTEYKTGDDMIYAQYLLDSGSDLQAVWVGRRDDDGDLGSEVSSLAVKFHGFADTAEYDLLAAEHYDARILALGGSVDYAEAVWRGDIMLTDADKRYTSLVLNWSYSWIAWNKNFSGTIEYYHNGFGIDDGDYAPAVLANETELVARVRRGELFTLGQDYLAGAMTIELQPLWLLTTTLFANLNDDSFLLQLFSQHDLAQDVQLLIAVNLPRGDDGSEFGGPDSTVADRPLAVDASLFAQLAWYF